jgi:nucleotide-binding universal stress UspA family protein
VVATPKHGINAPTDDEMEAREQRATDAIDAASATASEAGLDPTAAVEFGPSIHETIRSYIGDHDVDLAVVGTHGRTGFDRYVLGSVTEYLVRTSPIPVLTVRGSTEA